MVVEPFALASTVEVMATFVEQEHEVLSMDSYLAIITSPFFLAFTIAVALVVVALCFINLDHLSFTIVFKAFIIAGLIQMDELAQFRKELEEHGIDAKFRLKTDEFYILFH